MKFNRRPKRIGMRTRRGRRPASFSMLNELIERRQRLRKQIGITVAMFLSVVLMIEFV